MPAAGCKKSARASVVARVNGEPILAEEMTERLRQYRGGAESPLGPTPEAAHLKEQVLRELIEEAVLLAEAEKRNLEVAPEELDRETAAVLKDYPEGGFAELLARQKISRSRWKQRMKARLLIDKVIADVTKETPLPAAGEIEAYYKSHAEEFAQKEQLHLQQIVVKTAEDGEKILEELRNNKPFEELARAHSFTPEAGQGGDLGFVPPDVMPAAVRETIAKLPPRKPSPVIETEYGFHVVRVLERREPRQQTLAEATPAIIKILTHEGREKKFAAWRQEALSKSKVERDHKLMESLH